jgi:Ras-related GTP-binding protein C/D
MHRSGKSSINRVIFQNMSPHETLFLEATASCDISNTLSNRLVQFQTWDFGGDVNLASPLNYMGQDISFDQIFEKANTLVYVIDAQEDDYEHTLPKLSETIHIAYTANPNIHFEVFLHKVDGDFMSEDTKADRKQVNAHL